MAKKKPPAPDTHGERHQPSAEAERTQLPDEAALGRVKDLSDKIVDTVRDAMLVLDTDLRVVSANQAFYETFQETRGETQGRLLYELGNRQWDIPELRRLLEEVLPHNEVFNDFEVEHDFQSIGRRVMLLNGRRVDHIQRILLAIQDITEYRLAEQRRAFLLELSDAFRAADSSAAVLQQAVQRLCRFLHGVRAGYIELDDEHDRATILAQHAEGLPAVEPRHKLSNFGPDALATLQRGDDLIVEDVRKDPRTAPYADAYERNGVRSAIFTPQPTGGQRVAVLGIGWPQPQACGADEIELLREVADRTTSAVETVRAHEALRESEQRYRTLFESIAEGFCVIEVLFDASGRGVDHRFVDTNPAFERHTGLKNAVGKRARQLVPQLEPHWSERFGRVARTGKSQRFIDYSEAMGRWFEVDAFRFGDPRSHRVALLFNDITDRKVAERKLQQLNVSLEEQVTQRTEMLRILQDVTRLANEARTVDDAMQASLERISRYDGWQAGHVWWLAGDGSGAMVSSNIWHVTEHAKAAVGRLEEFQEICRRHRYEPGEPLIGEVAQSRQPRWVDDIGKAPDWRRGDAGYLGLHAAIAFPVTADSEVVAVLEFFSDKPTKREERFMEIMPDVGIQLGHVIERKRLERQVADAAEREQRRIGSDIHDGIGQELTGLRYIAQTHAESLARNAAPEAATAQRITLGLETVQKHLRTIIRALVPVEVDEKGLVAALRTLVRQTEQVHDIRCALECQGPVAVEDNLLATHIYRIAQEAVNNAARHAETDRITIRFTANHRQLQLRVFDDGVGIDPHRRRRGGFGLGNMTYRANIIGATLRIERRPEGGTMVHCIVPRPEIS